tara:strand:+ start:119 stop:283 length:165 start_codon:yes stop_codon:yes gene_type:complete
MTRASGKLVTAFSREWDMSIGMEQETLAATYLSVKGNQKAPLPAAYNEDRQHLE